MAPITEDYYAILEVSHTADSETIKKSFRRLARLLHPDKNPDKANATASFQLLRRAVKVRLRARKKAEKREAEAAETERKRAAEQSKHRQEQETARQERLRSLHSIREGYEFEVLEASRVVQQLKDELPKEENELKTLETAMQEVDDMIAARKEQEARMEQEQKRCEEPWRAPWEESREEWQK
ncbi:hypothetical protein H2199_004385 [Coniosporium tulheliwenetii]|uniref:Uncharacterized protein n=1 Tax=Coniosporium tulheliwenetii TaxID=3383036 RepID=A0ACC2Z598_9PEZI|nr:hypothetical protein H2199_004385 [Cladosporium sp. JES 115]